MEVKDFVAILARVILSDLKHQDYKTVTEYADRMKRLITGAGIEVELKQFNPREDTETFNQRKVLTQVTTPAITNSLMSPAMKIPRVKPLVNSNTVNGKPDVKLEDRLQHYFGNQSLDFFMEHIFLRYSYLDPNAFIVTTFDDFDHTLAQAKPYSVMIPSLLAWNYEYANGELQWLIVKSDPKSDIRWVMYTDKNVIDAKKISIKEVTDSADLAAISMADQNTVVNIGDTPKYIKKDNETVYLLAILNPKAGEIQPVRIGYILDETTAGRTCVSPLQPALSHLLRSIKEISEMDLSVSLHVFLQKFIYKPKCRGKNAKLGCDKGWTITGEVCSICGGTGFIPVHTTSADTIELPMPDDPVNMFDLSKLAHYQDMPMEIVKFLDEHIDKTERKCIKAIYASEIFQSDTVVSTATEKLVDMQSVYDTLYPLARQYAFVRKKIVRIVGSTTDITNLQVLFEFPHDFKLKSLVTLLGELKLANDSQAGAEVKQELNDDATKLIYIDRPQEYQKLRKQRMFNPFAGKTEADITFIIVNNLVTKAQKVMWSQSAEIWVTLEEANNTEEKNIYDMDYTVLKKLVDAEVALRVAALEADQPEPAAPLSGPAEPTGLPIGKPAPIPANPKPEPDVVS